MNRIKLSDHFYIDEVIPKEVYMQFYEKSVQFLDPRLAQMIEGIRNYFNVPITINNWFTGGDRHESGFRLPDTKTGVRLSQHKFGRAADLVFPKGTDYEKIRQTIRDKYDTFRKMGISTIEKDTNTWLHIDCRQTGMDKLYEVPYQ